MGYPVQFKGANSKLLAPKSMDELQCSDLPVFKNGVHCVSCWEFTEKEIEEIIKTKRVYVSLWSGDTQPPILLATENDIREAISDMGVWSKS